jgi:Pterin 4 alpha carbinolamine dehydratase
MTEILAEKSCTPCRGGVPPLGRDEAQRLQVQAPDWELRDDAHRIERTFRFRNFGEALAFVQRVAVARWRCQFWADCTTNISERRFSDGDRGPKKYLG